LAGYGLGTGTESVAAFCDLGPPFGPRADRAMNNSLFMDTQLVVTTREPISWIGLARFGSVPDINANGIAAVPWSTRWFLK
jgi:hypothetical protein